jgi:serine/threonine protein kinase
VLKFLPVSTISGATNKERFLREAQAAAALNHPNICTIHEIGEADGQFFADALKLFFASSLW